MLVQVLTSGDHVNAIAEAIYSAVEPSAELRRLLAVPSNLAEFFAAISQVIQHLAVQKSAANTSEVNSFLCNALHADTVWGPNTDFGACCAHSMMPACDLLACCACHGGYLFLQVVAEVNQQLQELVRQAQQVSASGDTSTVSQLMELRTSIAKLAAVQQQDVVASIASMAEKVAADPLYNLTSALTEFSDVSLGICDGCLCFSQHTRLDITLFFCK
jgi:hypothetical protein